MSTACGARDVPRERISFLGDLWHSCLHRTNAASGVVRQMFFAPEVSSRNKHRLGITFDKGFVSYFVWADLITLCCFWPFCSGRTFPILAVRTISMHAVKSPDYTLLLLKARAVTQEGSQGRFALC